MKGTSLILALAMSCAALADDFVDLRPDGLGGLKTGMDTGAMERLLKTKLGYSEALNHGCSVLTTKELEPRGIALVIESRHLTRINIDFYGTDPHPREIKTAVGIGLGSSEEDLLTAYAGRAKVKPHPADPTWHMVDVAGADGLSGIMFETDGKTVKSIRVGQLSAIKSPHGCD